MLDPRKNRITKKQRDRVYDEFFADAAVRVDWTSAAQSIDAEDRVVLGPWAGPEATISNLVHEMSHFVEIDERRMTAYGWGLHVPEIHIAGRVCLEPQTRQATERELRVIAFQANILEYLGFPRSVRDLVAPLDWMPDFVFVPIEDGSSAYGDDRTHKLSYEAIQKSQKRWCAKQVEVLRETFTAERFLSEWKRRNAVLKQREASERDRPQPTAPAAT